MNLKEQFQARGLSGTYPDGHRLERFDAVELAAALEGEVTRAGLVGHTKVSIHLDLIDAAALAAALRRLP